MKVQLIITINDDDTISLNGPLQNKSLCYGMLECARDVVKDFGDAQDKGQLIVPLRMPLPPTPGNGK